MTLFRSLLRTLAFTGLYVAAAYAGRLTVMDGTNLSLVWPAAGVSAVWFLAQYTSRYRWVDVLALSAATVAVNTATGASATLASLFAVANLVQAFVFVYLFRRWLGHLWGGGGDGPLARLHELWRLVAAASLSTAAGAVIGPTAVWVVNGSYSWPATAVWMTRNTVSILLVGAAGVRLGQLLHQHFTTHRHHLTTGLRANWAAMPLTRKGEYLAVVLLSTAGYYAVFGVNTGLPLAFAVLVMTVWAGLRLHTGFVIVHDVTFGSAAILFTLHHTGVFATITSNPTRALVAQLFVGIIAVVGLALALGRDERNTTAGDATMAAIDVSLAEIVTHIAAARIDLARSNGTPVPLFHLGDLHDVHADPVLVRQLLDNLISNAIKYVAPGVTPQITVDCETVDGVATVTVADNGIGIPAGEQESVFDNFHRAHRDAGYAGTGLGLGICKRIVERHGGTITVTDNPDGPGSRFLFTLPADSTTPSAPAARRRTDRPAPALGTAEQEPGSPQGRQSAVPKPGAGFEHTARLVLDYLHDEMPLAFWAITRVENGRQTFLYLDADNGYGLRQGDSHPWADSFCVHMAAGRAPTVAVDAQAVPAYAQAKVNDSVDIGAYAGAVITEPDGALFGVICGLDPRTRATDSRMAGAESLLVLLGHLLTTALTADRAQDRAAHALLMEQLSAETDALTGLPNRRAWHRLVDEARSRYERLADPTAVAMLDLDNLKTINDTQGHAAGDAYIAAAATAVRGAIRDTDVVARLGGDEFGLLLPHCTATDAETVIGRIHTALDAAGVAGSIGWAPITTQDGFSAALARADTAMYARKQQRRQKI